MELTPYQRRKEVVAILSTALASMPPVISIPPEAPPDIDVRNSPDSSRKSLEVASETRLNVTTDYLTHIFHTEDFT